MSESYTVMGMVLSAMPVNEYDKRLVILTREKGKISAFVRGARKPGNPHMAGSRPFSFGEFDLFEGRTSYTVTAMRIQNYFEELSYDFEATTYGCYFVEFADYYGRENIDGSEVIKLLYQSFRALLKSSIPNELVRRVFELRLMALNGEYPDLFTCGRCRTQENLHYFDFWTNSLRCDTCKEDVEVQLLEATVYTMQYVLTSPIEKLYTFNIKPEVLQEFSSFMDRELAVYIDRKMKSLDILESL